MRAALAIVTIFALLVAVAAVALASSGPMVGGGYIAVALSLATVIYAVSEWLRVSRGRASLLPLRLALVIVCVGVLASAIRVVGDTQSRRRSATTRPIPELQPSPTERSSP
jgi:CDP-diglyceride synthetase